MSDVFTPRCEWVLEQLFMGKDTVSRNDFIEKFKEGASGDWSRITRAVKQTLERFNYKVKLTEDENGIGVLHVERPKVAGTKRRYATDDFKPDEDEAEKQTIGRLVASYLYRRKGRNCLLGSGSSVYHVGLKMRDVVLANNKKRYSQLFWTVNVPLLADWCEDPDNSPLDHVLVPKGTLAMKTFRYSVMDPPTWDAPIVVVGADGCYFNRRSKTARFFANEDTVAVITNFFISNAVDSVICCLSSKKLKKDKGGRQAGPWIEAPSDPDIKRFLVTDKEIESEVIKQALIAAKWTIVTKDEDWIPREDESPKEGELPGPVGESVT